MVGWDTTDWLSSTEEIWQRSHTPYHNLLEATQRLSNTIESQWYMKWGYPNSRLSGGHSARWELSQHQTFGTSEDISVQTYRRPFGLYILPTGVSDEEQACKMYKEVWKTRVGLWCWHWRLGQLGLHKREITLRIYKGKSRTVSWSWRFPYMSQTERQSPAKYMSVPILRDAPCACVRFHIVVHSLWIHRNISLIVRVRFSGHVDPLVGWNQSENNQDNWYSFLKPKVSMAVEVRSWRSVSSFSRRIRIGVSSQMLGGHRVQMSKRTRKCSLSLRNLPLNNQIGIQSPRWNGSNEFSFDALSASASVPGQWAQPRLLMKTMFSSRDHRLVSLANIPIFCLGWTFTSIIWVEGCVFDSFSSMTRAKTLF